MAAAPRPLERGMAHVVVGGALLRVLQDLVGLVELLEFLLGVLVPGIAVGMAILGELAVGRLDVLLACAPGKPQNFVVARLAMSRSFQSLSRAVRRLAACHPRT